MAYRICGRRRSRAVMRRDVYGDEWICRAERDCDEAFYVGVDAQLADATAG